MRAFVAVLALASTTGCYTLRADVPGVMRDRVDDAVIVGTFDETVTRTYFFGGLIGPSDQDLFRDAMLESARAHQADGVANLMFEARFSPMDYALSIGTCAVVAPRTYRLKGDLVRLRGAPAPGRPLLNGPVVDDTRAP